MPKPTRRQKTIITVLLCELPGDLCRIVVEYSGCFDGCVANTFGLQQERITALLCLDDTRLCFGTAAGIVHVYNFITGEEQKLLWHQGSVAQLVCLSNGDLVVRTANGIVGVWLKSLSFYEVVQVPKTMNRCVAALRGNLLAIGYQSGTVRIRDMTTNTFTQNFLMSQSVVSVAQVGNDKLAAGTCNHNVHVWDLATGKCVVILTHQRFLAKPLIVSGATVYLSWTKKVRAWSADTGLVDIDTDFAGFMALGVWPSGHLVAQCANDSLCALDVHTGREVANLDLMNLGEFAVLKNEQVAFVSWSSAGHCIAIWE